MGRNKTGAESKPVYRVLTAQDFKRASGATLEKALQDALGRSIKNVFNGTKETSLYIDGDSISTVCHDSEIDYDPQWINQVKPILEGWGFRIESFSGPHFSKDHSRDNFHVKISW